MTSSSSRRKALDSALSKCTRMLPGQSVRLSDKEQEVLLKTIRQYEKNVDKPRRERRKKIIAEYRRRMRENE